MRTKLTDAEIAQALGDLPGWAIKDHKLHRDFTFADFVHAFGFMATAAIAIEKMNHHPEWFNVYNRVSVDLTTHDVGGISARDFELARALDALAAKLS
jgi:4a-hydroxytetrahydrobiopterin dehydratase